ncbi:MAG: hypothetical protein EZS28_039867, partial [Streblomastix strix]
MEKSTISFDQTATIGITSDADISTIIPRLIQELESDKINLHIPALKELLNIIIDNHQNKDFILKYNLIPFLNKFSENIEKNEEFVLSTTILHVIAVRNGSDDKTILAQTSIEQKEKDEKIEKLEQSNKLKDEQMKIKDEEIIALKLEIIKLKEEIE